MSRRALGPLDSHRADDTVLGEARPADELAQTMNGNIMVRDDVPRLRPMLRMPRESHATLGWRSYWPPMMPFEYRLGQLDEVLFFIARPLP